ncbi:MAG: sodium:proton antiporter [Gammaproteobacteria bacterium]|nr:sodium:proton antiporter [Gammaproteobacteria bacterium]
MSKFSTLIFISGLSFLLIVITAQLPIAHPPMLIGQYIIDHAVQDTGVTNIVTSVVLAYRGLDTLGELAILFTAASGVGLLLSNKLNTKLQPSTKTVRLSNSNFIIEHALNLLFPLLLVVGFYVIFHGHLTPGGGFQGGVIIASAFFLNILAKPYKSSDSEIESTHNNLTIIESLSGVTFIAIGLYALISGHDFLEPFLSHGQLGSLWSAGTLPFLYIAVGLKVGAELSSLLITLYDIDSEELTD